MVWLLLVLIPPNGSLAFWGLWVSECVCIIIPTLLFVYMYFEAEPIPP